MKTLASKKVTYSLALLASYSLMAFGRITSSYTKLASDPSYDFVEEINRLGIRSFVSGSEGYLQIGPRLIAYLAHWFPVQNQAVVLSLLASFAFIACAFIINRAISTQTGSALTGYVSGAILLLIPAASESTVGNHGSVKWSIVVALCIVLICPVFINQYPKSTIAISIVSTLCSPLSILAYGYLVWSIAINRRSSDRKIVIPFLSVIAFTFIQFLYWLFSGKGATIYGGDIRYLPWPGMGQFWWSLILTPPVFVIGSFMFLGCSKLIFKEVKIQQPIFLALTTTILTFASFITTGIKDSTAVAWQSLSWILVILTLQEVTPKLKPRLVGYVAIALCSAFFLRSIEKWYSASWYLTDGREWSVLISEAKMQCLTDSSEFQKIELLLSEVEVRCDDL
jgi:hypothetical protein